MSSLQICQHFFFPHMFWASIREFLPPLSQIKTELNWGFRAVTVDSFHRRESTIESCNSEFCGSYSSWEKCFCSLWQTEFLNALSDNKKIPSTRTNQINECYRWASQKCMKTMARYHILWEKTFFIIWNFFFNKQKACQSHEAIKPMSNWLEAAEWDRPLQQC